MKPCVVKTVGDQAQPICAYLSDGTKITVGRSAETHGPAWLKIEQQATVRPAAGCSRCTSGFIRCNDPECATCASDNDPVCPNATHCPTCICGRRAPVQGDYGIPNGRRGPGTIAWSEHLQAWSGYAAKYGTGQSAERIAERSGFSYGELVMFLGHEPTTWEPRRTEKL